MITTSEQSKHAEAAVHQKRKDERAEGREKSAAPRLHHGCKRATTCREISSFPLVLLEFLPYAPLIVGFP